MGSRTHYDNLKVARNAPTEVIQAAYRALSKKYHPDLNSDSDAARIMRIINASYEVLSDPVKRKEYDASLIQEEKEEQENWQSKRETSENNVQESSKNAEAREDHDKRETAENKSQKNSKYAGGPEAQNEKEEQKKKEAQEKRSFWVGGYVSEVKFSTKKVYDHLVRCWQRYFLLVVLSRGLVLVLILFLPVFLILVPFIKRVLVYLVMMCWEIGPSVFRKDFKLSPSAWRDQLFTKPVLFWFLYILLAIYFYSWVFGGSSVQNESKKHSVDARVQAVLRQNEQTAKEAIRNSLEAAKKHYDLGSSHYKLGKYQEAISEYREVIRIKPNEAVAHFALGLSYGAINNHQEAISEYKEVIRIKPGHASAHAHLGVSYSKLGKDQEAIAEYKEAIRIKPDYVYAHDRLGVAYEKLGNSQEAIAEYKEAIRIKPDYVYAHHSLGSLYRKLGKDQKAIAEYKEAIRIKPDNALAHDLLGGTHFKLGKYPDAMAEYMEAIRIKPDRAPAHISLGFTYAKLGKHEESTAEFKEAIRPSIEAIRINPDNDEAHTSLGVSYFELGKYPEAMAEFKDAIRIKPDIAEWHSNLGKVYGKLGKYQEAIAEFNEAIRIRSDNAGAHFEFGVIYDLTQNGLEAITHTLQAKRLATEQNEVHLLPEIRNKLRDYFAKYSYKPEDFASVEIFGNKAETQKQVQPSQSNQSSTKKETWEPVSADQVPQEVLAAFQQEMVALTPLPAELKGGAPVAEKDLPFELRSPPPAVPSNVVKPQEHGLPKANTGKIYGAKGDEILNKSQPPPGMVTIPGGTFYAGLQGEPDNPPRTLYIEIFSMDKYEVMQAEYEKVMGNNLSYFKGSNLPVERVTWYEANEYCRKVGKRLPTEWEWEKAAKGEMNTVGKIVFDNNAVPVNLLLPKFPWGDNEDDAGRYAWYYKNSGGTTQPVGQKEPNGYGLYDMG